MSHFYDRYGELDLRAVAFAGMVLSGVVAVAVWGGFQLGERYGQHASTEIESDEVHAQLVAERRRIVEVKVEQRAHLDALALKIAELQAHMMRLDALGDRLVDVGNLDKDEFDFASPPPLGGIDDQLPNGHGVGDLRVDMDRIAGLLTDREDKLLALEQVLMSRKLMAEVLPSGRPVFKGWMSSGYGKRTDPFKGSKSFHRGLDFAGKPGTDVVSVAAGVVTRAEKAPGYGNVVEVRHADGFSTLYGHNQKNLVKVGDMVEKGQRIALLGSTGRSSGPHVHFEVHRNGKIVNPLRFVQAR